VEVNHVSTQAAAEPWWVESNRARKAAQIAAALQAMGVTAEAAADYDHRHRRAAEAAAGTRKGSNATWRVVIEMLAGSARGRALCPFCGLGDPEGEPGPPMTVGHQGPCRR
jgi:hypothetical protein